MQYVYSPYLADETNKLPIEDDIDKLFDTLQPIQPPSFVIENILKTVSRLSLPNTLPGHDTDKSDGIVVRKEKDLPS
ncbi:MAG: hypothetical protein M3Z24_04390 [Chloroflexota bacterium]|nr:hypothetical protein [Chloroflexota bacterium]